MLQINHTARSWGVDIEALVSGHLQTLRKSENSLSSWVWENAGLIGFLGGFLFFIGSLVGSYLFMISFGEIQQIAASEILKLGTSAEEMDKKIDFAINTLLIGLWPRFTLGLISFIIVSLMASVFIGVWIGEKASNKPVSVLLLTKESKKHHKQLLKLRTKGWFQFAFSIIGGVITGVAANYIFQWLIT